MQRRWKRQVSAAALSAVLAAFTVAVTGCSDAQGVDSPFDANLIGSAQAGLTGTWILNADLSDKPGDQMRPEGRPGFGSGRPEGHPNIGEGERPGRPSGDGPGPRGLPPKLEISQTDETVTFAGPEDQSHTLYTDGRIETHELPNGGEVQVQAGWSDGALVIVRTGDRGTHTETMALSADEQQLLVTVRIAPADAPDVREFRLVYDRG